MKSAEWRGPQLVHAHYSRENQDLPFWLALAGESGGPVLELGCGTGRVLIPLALAGYTAVGLDHDAGMLAFLRGTTPVALRGRVHLVQGELSAFHFGRQFPLILLPCNTLSTLDRSQRGRLFERVRRHLAPGGLFAASIPNPAWLLELPPVSEPEVEETIAHPLTGHPVQISSAWTRDELAFHLSWHYDHLLPDGQVERLTLETAHNLAQAEDFRQEFEAAGLRLGEMYGDFDGSPFDADSANLIFVAEEMNREDAKDAK